MSTCEGRLTWGPKSALSAGPLGGGAFTRLSNASRDADALLKRPSFPSLPATHTIGSCLHDSFNMDPACHGSLERVISRDAGRVSIHWQRAQ